MRIFKISLLAATLLAVPTLALTQTAEQRTACEGDVRRYCAGVPPGGGRILECLARQEGKLSQACKKVLESQKR